MFILHCTGQVTFICKKPEGTATELQFTNRHTQRDFAFLTLQGPPQLCNAITCAPTFSKVHEAAFLLMV